MKLLVFLILPIKKVIEKKILKRFFRKSRVVKFLDFGYRFF